MQRTDFAEYVAKSQHDHPLWFDLPSDEPADEAALMEAEEALGVRFPSDFRWFLQTFGGGDFAFVTIYSLDPESDLNIRQNQPEVDPKVLAFSDDGTGNLFVFPVTDGVCVDQVLLLEHESGEARPFGTRTFLEFVLQIGLRTS